MKENIKDLIKEQGFIEFDNDSAPGSMVKSEVVYYDKVNDEFDKLTGDEVINKDDAVLFKEVDDFDSISRSSIFLLGEKVYSEDYTFSGYEQDSEANQEFIKNKTDKVFDALLEKISGEQPVEKNELIETVKEQSIEADQERVEELKGERSEVQEKLDKANEKYDDKRFDYIREVYENSTEGEGKYILGEDSDFKEIVESIEEKEDEIEDLQEEINAFEEDLELEASIEKDEDEDQYEGDLEDNEDFENDDYRDS